MRFEGEDHEVIIMALINNGLSFNQWARKVLLDKASDEIREYQAKSAERTKLAQALEHEREAKKEALTEKQRRGARAWDATVKAGGGRRDVA